MHTTFKSYNYNTFYANSFEPFLNLPIVMHQACKTPPFTYHLHLLWPATYSVNCDQVVVQQLSIWIMIHWTSFNLVMEVLLPLAGASMDRWNFIRFYGALVCNSKKVLYYASSYGVGGCEGGTHARTTQYSLIVFSFFSLIKKKKKKLQKRTKQTRGKKLIKEILIVVHL